MIEKPFDANTLVETVKEALSNHNRLTSMLQNQRGAGSAQERRQLTDVISGSGLRLAIRPIVQKFYGGGVRLRDVAALITPDPRWTRSRAGRCRAAWHAEESRLRGRGPRC